LKPGSDNLSVQIAIQHLGATPAGFCFLREAQGARRISPRTWMQGHIKDQLSLAAVESLIVAVGLRSGPASHQTRALHLLALLKAQKPCSCGCG
jgi:hypothetical protein